MNFMQYTEKEFDKKFMVARLWGEDDKHPRTEIAWFASDDDGILGTIVEDMHEHSYSAVVYMKKHPKFYSHIDFCCDIDDIDEAEAIVKNVMEHFHVYANVPHTNEYRVHWEIDVSAKNPREAAFTALEVMRSLDSIATEFTVTNMPVKVDLKEYEVNERVRAEEEKPMRRYATKVHSLDRHGKKVSHA
jgi:hypothetical protein